RPKVVWPSSTHIASAIANSTAIVHDTAWTHPLMLTTSSAMTATAATIPALIRSHDRSLRDSGRRRRSAVKAQTARSATPIQMIADGNLWPKAPRELGPENQLGNCPFEASVGDS